MKQMIVFHGIESLPIAGRGAQQNVCIAAPSKAAAVRALNACGVYITSHRFKEWWGETGNDLQIEAAMSAPGELFWSPLNGPQAYQQYVKERK